MGLEVVLQNSDISAKRVMLYRIDFHSSDSYRQEDIKRAFSNPKTRDIEASPENLPQSLAT